MSLWAKIRGLDLGPVIICCQIFLSMKWNNSMISANLCPPPPITSPDIYAMQVIIMLLFIKSNVWLILVFHSLCHLRFSHCLDRGLIIIIIEGSADSNPSPLCPESWRIKKKNKATCGQTKIKQLSPLGNMNFSHRTFHQRTDVSAILKTIFLCKCSTHWPLLICFS